MDLIVYWDEQPIERITLPWIQGEQFTIGRTDDNGLILNNRGISRRHAIITVRAEADYLIEDNDSLNGTFINGQKISEAREITFGDKITIGGYTIMVACSQREHSKKYTETKQSSKGETTMTNLVKICMYLAFGILGGFSLFWGNIALVFLIAIPVILWVIPHKIHWWGAIMMAVGHGITFYVMRGEGSGLLITLVSGLIYLVLLSWRQNEWKKKHPPTTVNARR